MKGKEKKLSVGDKLKGKGKGKVGKFSESTEKIGNITLSPSELLFIKRKMVERQEELEELVYDRIVKSGTLQIFEHMKDVFHEKKVKPLQVDERWIDFQLDTFLWIAWVGKKAWRNKGEVYLHRYKEVRIPSEVKQKSLEKIVSAFSKFLNENKNNPALLKIAKEFPKLRDFRIDEKYFTAEISKGGYVRVSIWLLEEYALSSEDIAFVILHELKHKVNGDLVPRVLSEEYEEENIRCLEGFVLDLLINSFLLKHIFGWKYPKGVERFYKKNASQNIFFLLMFPPFWLRKDAKKRKAITTEIARYIKDKLKIEKEVKSESILKKKSLEWAERFVRLWEQAWSGKVSANFIYKEILFLISGVGATFEFGGFDEIVFEGFERNEGEVKLPGYSSQVKEKEVEPDRSREAREIYEAVRRALSQSGSNVILTEMIVPDVSVLPFPSRKDLFLLLRDVWPTFFKYFIPGKEEDFMATRVYLDVSGSFEEYIGFTIGLLNAVSDYIAQDIYCFSNVVFPVRKEDLFKGKIATTWGTDFDCVAEHALEHGFKKILVITDGWANLKPHLKEELRKRVDVYVVLVGRNAYTSSDIIDVAGRTRYGEKWWWYSKEY